MSDPSQDRAVTDSSSSHNLALASISLACSLGCAAAAVPRSIHPTRGQAASCASPGRDDPRARPYTAVVETAAGGSAFEDRALCLEEGVILRGEPPVDTAQLSPARGVLFLRCGPFDLAPHQAPRRQWVVPLRGELQVTVTDGTSRRFGPGDLILVTDTTGSGHATLSIGEPPFELLFVPVE